MKLVEILCNRLRSRCTLNSCFWCTMCFQRGRAKCHGNIVQIYPEEGKQRSEEIHIDDNKVNIRKVRLYCTNRVSVGNK